MMDQQAQVLIVDDDASVLGFVEELLAIDGFQVTSVTNGASALESIAKQEFDLAIIDLKMRVVDGLKVLEELYSKSPDTSAIILTGHGSMETAVTAMRYGAHDYLLKPCSAESLRQSVHTGLKRRRNALMARINEEMLADVSHQLRSPITGIQLSLELLEQSKVDRTDEYLKLIKKETQRMEQLIDDTFALSQSRPSQSTSLTGIDLNFLITQIIDIYQERATARNLRLTFEPASNLPLVHIDRHQMDQVISTLIDNAIKYTPSGNITIRTVLSNASEDAPMTLLLEVQDTGIGISMDDQPYVFERYYRGQQAKRLSDNGQGLGLAIVREIVGTHGGTVGVESQPNEGSTFRVWLPVT